MATPEEINERSTDTMVIIGTTRYQRADAERLGLLKAKDDESPEKQREPAKNKARTPKNTK